MHRVSNPPRGPRGPSPSVRSGAPRGGIQKRGRTGQSPRIDTDGDLFMDAAGEKGRAGRGRLESPRPYIASRGGGGPARGSRLGPRSRAGIVRGMEGKQANVTQPYARPTATLEVHGLAQSKAASNPDGGLQSLLGFIERKANAKSTKPVKIKKSQIRSDSVVIITASPEDIITIETLEGFQFAAAPLSFKPVGPLAADILKSLEKRASNTEETKEKLKGILATRYNAELHLLNLSELANDAGLKEMGVFDGTTTTSKIFPALMAVCSGLFQNRKAKSDAVSSVTLANNGLTTISDVFVLATTFPDLKNLDLSQNNLADLKSIDGWKQKFRLLENLMLNGNPIEQQLPTIKDDLLKRYPKLQIINNVQLRTAEDIAAAEQASKSRPLPIPILGASFRDVGQVGENFIRQFFPLYDTNRALLASTYYDGESVHSMSVNMVAPHDKAGPGSVPSWQAYTPHSRNLTKITHLPSRMGRQKRGLQRIQELWSLLPATRHPDLQTSSDKYLFECTPVPGLPDPTGRSPGGVDGLMLVIHGEFEEPNPNSEESAEPAMRSFSRTFILGPGAPGGNPIRVISDMMALRPWSPIAKPAPMPDQQQLRALSPPNTQAAPQTQMLIPSIQLTDQQRQEAMAMELVERSGMTLQYSVLCLTETGWDLEKAFMAFTANKDKLPADAWIVR